MRNKKKIRSSNRHISMLKMITWLEKKAHDIRKNVNGDFTRVLEIDESPYASLETRPLEDLSEPVSKNNNVWVESDELPF